MEPLFVYVNKLGDVRVEDSTGAALLAADPALRLIASLEPRTYIQNILNQNAKLVAALMVENNTNG